MARKVISMSSGFLRRVLVLKSDRNATRTVELGKVLVRWSGDAIDLLSSVTCIRCHSWGSNDYGLPLKGVSFATWQHQW